MPEGVAFEIMKFQMKYLKFVVLLPLLTLFAGRVNAQNDEASVKEINAQFYKALDAIFKGDSEPMKAVWSHADDITYMGPDGSFQKGWDQVLAEWQKQAARNLGGKIETSDTVFNVGKTIATTHTWVKGQHVDKEGKPLMVSIRATSIFRKEGDKWKMIGHHTDTLPFLQK